MYMQETSVLADFKPIARFALSGGIRYFYGRDGVAGSNYAIEKPSYRWLSIDGLQYMTSHIEPLGRNSVSSLGRIDGTDL
jgi:hypothetical protein